MNLVKVMLIIIRKYLEEIQFNVTVLFIVLKNLMWRLVYKKYLPHAAEEKSSYKINILTKKYQILCSIRNIIE